MALFVPCAGVAEVRLLTIVENRPVCNSIYAYRNPATVTLATLQNLCFWVGLWYRLEIVRKMHETSLFYATIAKHLDSPTGLSRTDNTWGGFGQTAGTRLANNVSLRVNFHTAEPGRSGRGCNYVPGLLKEYTNGSFATETFKSSIISAYEGLYPRMATAGWQWVVYSRENEGNVRAIGAFFPVTSVQIPERKLADMGRRLVGVGEIPA